eukprot:Nk52_evm78s270 gene=Nk52_evmTU78s270
MEEQRKLSAYERAEKDLKSSKTAKEIVQGKRIGFYKMRNELGAGNFASVKLGIHELVKEKVAVKIVDKSKLDVKYKKHLQREISAMEDVHHPNILELFEVIETHHKMYIIMEYAPGGDVFTKVCAEGRFAEDVCKPMFAHVLAGINHCHDKGIVHRDIKAQNLLFDQEGNVKVADFGFSTQSDGDFLTTFCGSPPYAAPELFREEDYDGTKVDMWALGVLCFFMCTGNMPFHGDSVAKIRKKVLEGSFEIPSFLSPDCAELISGLLTLNPDKRWSCDKAMRCKWLEGQEYPEALDKPRTHTEEDEEEIIRAKLKELGVPEVELEATCKEDSRSHITGTYRLLKLKLRKGNLVNEADAEEEEETADGGKLPRSAIESVQEIIYYEDEPPKWNTDSPEFQNVEPWNDSEEDYLKYCPENQCVVRGNLGEDVTSRKKVEKAYYWWWINTEWNTVTGIYKWRSSGFGVIWDPKNVQVLPSGDLRLVLSQDSETGHIHSAQVALLNELSYGTYQFTVQLDKDWWVNERKDQVAMFGAFTFQYSSSDSDKGKSGKYHNIHHELDAIEITKFSGRYPETDAQFAIQPWSHRDNIHRIQLDKSFTTYTIVTNWYGPNKLAHFKLYNGDFPNFRNVLYEYPDLRWTSPEKYNRDIPNHDMERFMFNLWHWDDCCDGNSKAPVGASVTVKNFQWTPFFY